MYSPWTTSMPCLFSANSYVNHRNDQLNLSYNSQDSLIGSLNNLDLSNPFNIVATLSPSSSIWSLNHFNCNHDQMNEQEIKRNHFEPLPFSDIHHQTQANNYAQLSQKHAIVKQMIARKTAQHQDNPSRSHYNSCENVSLGRVQRRKRSICTFCKSNGESANVYTSHVLRNVDNEIECPILMAYVCPKCGATGKSAHTIKYCTALSESERVALPTVKSFKEGRTSSGKKNLFKNERSFR